VLVLLPVKPPARLPQPAALDAELYDMAKAEERGFVRFPPPPPPTTPGEALARFGQAPIVETESDPLRTLTRVLIWIALGIAVFSIWYLFQ